MANVMNTIPIAVHIASGGDARVRTGGGSISLNGIASGSFQVSGGTRYRLQASLRSAQSGIIIGGYSSPLSISNASFVCADSDVLIDDVPQGATVYFKLLDPITLEAMEGSSNDYVYYSIYG